MQHNENIYWMMIETAKRITKGISEQNFSILLTLQQSSSDQITSESNTFLVVLFYCLLIIFSPIVAFFVSKVFIFDDWATPVKSNIYSAISAVVTLHVALGMYLYRASVDSSPATGSRSAGAQLKED